VEFPKISRREKKVDSGQFKVERGRGAEALSKNDCKVKRSSVAERTYPASVSRR
jgi:hypothetical protein